MEHIRDGDFPSRTVSLSDYLQTHEHTQSAHVQTGAWNVGDTSGYDFAQWAGSDSQRQAVEKVIQVSHRYHHLAQQKIGDQATERLLKEAHHQLLEGQTN